MKPTVALGCCLLIGCGAGDLSSGGGIDLEPELPNIDITGTWRGQASCALRDSARRFEYGITINFQQDPLGRLTGSVGMPPCLQLMPIIDGSILGGGICGDTNAIDFRAEGLGRSIETASGLCNGLTAQQPNGPFSAFFKMVTDVSGCPAGSHLIDFDAPSSCFFNVSR